MIQYLDLSCASRRTRHFRNVGSLGGSGQLAYPICEFYFTSTSISPDYISSSVKHLEEIKNAGYDMPSVNQIEVFLSLRVDVIALNPPYGGAKAPSVLPTKAYRHLLSSKLDYSSGILPPDTGTNGSPRHPGSIQ